VILSSVFREKFASGDLVATVFSYRSDEETSGDEAEDHETDEENAEGEDEDKPLEASKAAEIQKL
jgi:hypothetical protein